MIEVTTEGFTAVQYSN